MYLLVLILISILGLYHFYWKRRNLPPGPTPLPIFGNTLEILRKEPGYEAYKAWSKKFGPIYTIWYGENPIVVITDYNLIIETFKKDGETYAGRPNVPSLEKARGGRWGIVFTDGELWRDQRSFFLRSLQNFGVGKDLMQERILAEFFTLKERICNDLNKGIQEHNISAHIDICIGSIINNLLFGYRFEGETEHEFCEMKKLAGDFVRFNSHPCTIMIQNHMEIAKHLPFFKYYYHRLKNARNNLNNFCRRQIEEHQKRVDHNSEPTDIVEAFLREKIKKEKEGNAEFYNMQQLIGLCTDVWTAGQETTSSTIIWGIIYLMLNQEIQNKLHDELDKVISSDRMITKDDQSDLHYMCAVVNEIQRIANLVVLNVRHRTTRDANINGHHIPKGTTIVPQMCAVLYDEKIFPNYEKFDPDRFLDENGHWKRVDELIPFSIGKRQCAGSGLARMELFLFTANIFNQFKIRIVPTKPPSLVRKIGGAVAPQPFVCYIEKRF